MPLDRSPGGHFVTPQLVWDFTALFADKFGYAAFRCGPPWGDRLVEVSAAVVSQMDAAAREEMRTDIRTHGFAPPWRVWVYMRQSSRSTADLRVKRLEGGDHSAEVHELATQLRDGVPTNNLFDAVSREIPIPDSDH
jgi:hypothetical protein